MSTLRGELIRTSGKVERDGQAGCLPRTERTSTTLSASSGMCLAVETAEVLKKAPFQKRAHEGVCRALSRLRHQGFESDYVGDPHRDRFAVELGRFVLTPFGGVENRLIK